MASSTSLNKPARSWKTSGAITHSSTHSLGLIEQQDFVRMLRVERKRTERSGKPFILILLHGGALLNGKEALASLVAALAPAIRETDSLGWYRREEVLGILFTEIERAEGGVIHSLVNKVKNSLHEKLKEADSNEITLTYHVYPENGNHLNKGAVDIRLYPDLPQIATRRKAALVAKRTIDVFGSLFAILLFLPLFLLLAVVIKLTSPGPVLFRQKRIGQHGKLFTFLKFRSMHTNNNSEIHQEYVKKFISGQDGVRQPDGRRGAFKLTNDPRVTRVGRFLRRTSLDELPQFFNVLNGEMSLVGPRPPVLYEYEAYDIWHRDRMMVVKPGITGLWQVSGRSRTTFDEMVRLDLKYASSWSILMDLKILLKTPKAVLSGEGAY